MSFYTDISVIVTTSQDEWGKITQSIGDNQKCRIEDFNQLIKDQQGNEVMPEMLIIYPPGVNIFYDNFIQVKKKMGNDFDQPNKLFSIKKIYKAGGFKNHHIEVYCDK